MGGDFLSFGECAERVALTVSPSDVAEQPYVGLEHIAPNTLHLLGVGRASDVQSTKAVFRQGDILFGKLRPYFRKVVRARFSGVCSTDIWVVRARPGVDQRFLHYWMASPDFIAHAMQGADGTGMPRAKWEFVARHRVAAISEVKQRAIGGILGALDDKIDVDSRTVVTLEATLRALFKSWFVDFDPVRAKARGEKPAGMDEATAKLFPSELVDSELGPVPKGWRVARLGEVCSEYRQTVQPRDVPSETPYIGLEHMPPRNIALHAWGSARDAQSQKSRFSRGDILFGKLRPYFHKVGVAAIDGVCSTDIVVLRPLTPSWFGFVLGHASSEAFVAYTNASADGTRMPRTSWSRMAGYPTVAPGEACAAAFDQVARALVERQRAAIFEMQSLASTRDELLPKLLSGELRVPAA